MHVHILVSSCIIQIQKSNISVVNMCSVYQKNILWSGFHTAQMNVTIFTVLSFALGMTENSPFFHYAELISGVSCEDE